MKNYIFDAKVINVVDGDTIDCDVDLGFRVMTNVRFRLDGIDTPEVTSTVSENRVIAKNAKQFLIDQVLNKPVILESKKTDKYGRWLAVIRTVEGSVSLNEQLVSLGFAKAYFGGSKQSLWD